MEIQTKEIAQEVLEKVQQEIQYLKNEKEQLRAKVEDLEAQQYIIYESNNAHTQGLKEQLASLTAELETTKEHQVDLQPFKEYILAQKDKMLQLHTAFEEERCKVLHMDSRLEEIIETSSYFIDRSQDVLEVLSARMAIPEDDAEIPGELPAKDHQTLRRDHSLVEFAISTAEEFKKVVRRTQVACSEFFKRFLNAYNRC